MKNFEKYTSGKLEQYQSPVDTDKLWAGIDTQLRPRRKKRWLFLLLLPATGIAGLMLYYAGDRLPTTPSEAPMAHAINSSAITKVSHKAAVAALQQAQQVNFVNPPIETPSAFSLNRDRKITTGLSSPTPSKSIYYKENTKAVTVESSLSTPSINTKTIVQIEVETVPETLPVVVQEQPVFVPQNKAAQRPQTLENSTATAGPLSVANRLPHTQPGLSHQKKTKLPKHVADCFDWKTKSFTPFVSVYGGLAYPVRHLNLKNTLYTADFDKRNITEDVLESWHSGITMGISHRSGLSVEGGLHYQQINERFYSSQFLRDTMGSQLVITTIIHAPGDTSKFEEYRPIVRETTTTSERYNRYRFLSIPVSVTYERNMGRKWRPYIRAGAMVNLMAMQTATLYYAKAPEKFDSGAKPLPSYYPFKTRVGVDVFGALGVRRSVSSQFSVFGEIRYQHPLYEITRSDYAIGQRYRLPGITTGTVFSF